METQYSVGLYGKNGSSDLLFAEHVVESVKTIVPIERVEVLDAYGFFVCADLFVIAAYVSDKQIQNFLEMPQKK